MTSHDSIITSKAIQRRTGRTFHVATRLLPTHVRQATYVLYAFFRITDEVVDDPDPPSLAIQRQELDRIRAAVLGGETDDPVLLAVRDVLERYEIDDGEVAEFVSAMEMDVTKDRYETDADRMEYLRGSSVAVAYMMLAVMNPDEPEKARPHAKALGEAFQLTNFLRDVREDIREYGRIYLPRERMDTHGVSETEIKMESFSEKFAAMMRAELKQTEELYRTGVAGIKYLPDECQFAVLLAAVLYADHHRLIRQQGYDVLTNRPNLSRFRRFTLLVRTWSHWRWTDDPETVFYRVSAVSETEAESEQNVVSSRNYSHFRPSRCRGLQMVVNFFKNY